jgi:hypothetical protein
MLVSLWVEADNGNRGYWNRFDVPTMLEAKAYCSTHTHNWSIRPNASVDNQTESTWMIAMLSGDRIGSRELWAEYDAIQTGPISIIMPCDTPDEVTDALVAQFGNKNVSWDDDYILNNEFCLIINVLNATERQILDTIGKHCMLCNVWKVIK